MGRLKSLGPVAWKSLKFKWNALRHLERHFCVCVLRNEWW